MITCVCVLQDVRNSEGNKCNLHSWFGKYSCCYTSDHKNPECVWNKPLVGKHSCKDMLSVRNQTCPGAKQVGQAQWLRDLCCKKPQHKASAGLRAVAELPGSLCSHHPRKQVLSISHLPIHSSVYVSIYLFTYFFLFLYLSIHLQSISGYWTNLRTVGCGWRETLAHCWFATEEP